uniref:Uncharacterized protein n=1 Tax=Myoviridae sp. cteo515 TaxID=2823550 RepID=A0A8S5LB99_9CAUD|nr:MAG TPA: hypothetical protein [Myoviridae sp. cteo515]
MLKGRIKATKLTLMADILSLNYFFNIVFNPYGSMTITLYII